MSIVCYLVIGKLLHCNCLLHYLKADVMVTMYIFDMI